jgi:hypothetical protein
VKIDADAALAAYQKTWRRPRCAGEAAGAATVAAETAQREAAFAPAGAADQGCRGRHRRGEEAGVADLRGLGAEVTGRSARSPGSVRRRPNAAAVDAAMTERWPEFLSDPEPG